MGSRGCHRPISEPNAFPRIPEGDIILWRPDLRTPSANQTIGGVSLLAIADEVIE